MGEEHNARCQLWAGPAAENTCHGIGTYTRNDGVEYTVVQFKGEVIKVSKVWTDGSGKVETFSCHKEKCDYHGPLVVTEDGDHAIKMYDRNSVVASGTSSEQPF